MPHVYLPAPAAHTRTVDERLDELGRTIKDFEAANFSGDSTASLQAAIDDAATLAQGVCYGAELKVPRGIYYIGNVTLRPHVQLVGRRQRRAHQHTSPRFVAIEGTSGYLFQTEDVADCAGWGLHGVGVYGNAAKCPALAGVGFRSAKNAEISGCVIESFAQEAVSSRGVSGTATEACQVVHIVDNFLKGLLGATPLAQKGVLSITGADNRIKDNEIAGPSYTSVSGPELFKAAGWIDGANHFISKNVFELGDIGALVDASLCKFEGNRYDVNAGHGLSITPSGGANIWNGEHSHNNSQASDNDYDNIIVDGADNVFGVLLSSIYHPKTSNRPRYGLNDLRTTPAWKNDYWAYKAYAPSGWGTGPLQTDASVVAQIGS